MLHPRRRYIDTFPLERLKAKKIKNEMLRNSTVRAKHQRGLAIVNFSLASS